MMVVIAMIAHMANGESAEWQEEDELDITGLTVTETDHGVNGLPLCSMEDHSSPPRTMNRRR